MGVNKVYSISIIFAAISLSLIAFLIYPTLHDIKNISDRISEDKNSAALITAEAYELDDFKKNYGDRKANLNKIDQLFVDAKNPIDFIKFLENTVLVSGVDASINLSNAPQSKQPSVVQTVIFQISAQGDFLNILKFFNMLETGEYLIKIQNLSIRESAKEIIDGKEVSKGVEANLIIEAIAQ